ncbi:beta-aspartyl-peptidase [Reinekea sp.]|jgi:beta-aspartyl-dipeptidase (metallo-type)|uniref:beta-aspartyl-peptidase n=1 Tax=Reinekea sp. TaxID=1970455 RepID=UPI0039890782
MSFILFRNANVYAPSPLGLKDVLVSHGRISEIADTIVLEASFEVEIIDVEGHILCPGFVDTLTHVTGGGGEGGFATRTPEMNLSHAIAGGVTTVTGALGTDAVCRSHEELVAKVKGLKEEGLSAYFYTGNYHYPVKTLTGSVQKDIMLIDECIGIGEIAIADHRGSQLTWRELASVAAEARVGGMCAKKAGIVSVHVGPGDERLDRLFEVAEKSDIPLKQFYPTHINRSELLLEQGVKFNQLGGYIDFTASSTPDILASGEVKCAHALKQAIAAGADENRITFSTDGHASLPNFNSKGELVSLKVGAMTSMHAEFKDAVQIEQIKLETALKVVTQNPAKVLQLTSKGQIIKGADADILILNNNSLAIESVLAKGQWLMKQTIAVRKGTYE